MTDQSDFPPKTISSTSGTGRKEKNKGEKYGFEIVFRQVFDKDIIHGHHMGAHSGMQRKN